MKRLHSLGPAALILGAMIGASLLPTQARAIAIFFEPAISPFNSIGDQITV